MICNFAAGPAMLPPPVLAQAAAELQDFRGCGMSVMEISHRSPLFEEVHFQAIADFRRLLAVPEDYEVLFLQGGGQGENAFVPLNLCGHQARADVIVNGHWSRLTATESAKFADIHIAAESAPTTYPAIADWRLRENAAYLHLCSNETINGIESLALPDPCPIPVVADMSSHILSRQIDVARYGVIYAGAQKNIACAGLTIVVVRRDLLNQAQPTCPIVFHWQTQAKYQSLYNTPPTFAIYLAGLVFKWLDAQGGIGAIEQQNRTKSALLYDTIDRSGFYQSRVDPNYRSRMNVAFFLQDESRNDAFLQACKKADLVNLKGHKAVGGMRASLYNAMPLAGVERLVEVMRDFERLSA